MLGLNVAGVDMLRSNRGPVVIEVNSSPGIEGMEQASGADVAGAMIEFLEKRARRGRDADARRGLDLLGMRPAWLDAGISIAPSPGAP